MAPAICFADAGVHTLGLDVGQVFLSGKYADNYSNNLGYGLHYNYGTSDIFDFDAALAFSKHDERALKLANLSLGLKTNFVYYDQLVPFGLIGLGFYKPELVLDSGGATQEEASKIAFGLHAGVGCDLNISKRMSFGLSLTYHEIFGVKDTSIASKPDISGSYYTFFLRMGVNLF